MADDLPKRHPSAYSDPLEADDKRDTIGVVNEADGRTIAVGNEEVEGEWILMEADAVPVRR